MQTEADAIQRFYAAINGNDFDAMSAVCAPDLVRVEPAGFPTSGTYHGLAQFRELVRKGRGSWAEGGCAPEAIVFQGAKAVVDVHVHVRLQGATDWIDARIADAFAFRDGKIAAFLTFVDRNEARRWAGIELE